MIDLVPVVVCLALHLINLETLEDERDERKLLRNDQLTRNNVSLRSSSV